MTNHTPVGPEMKAMSPYLNLNRNLLAPALVLAVLGLCGAGCQTHKAVLPQSGGYEEVSHPHHTLIDEPDPPRISLQHRDAGGKVTQIWPSLSSAYDVIKGDLALFVAEKAFVEPERVTHPRLFAVRSPDLPLDLTDEILWRWSKANNKDFGKTMDKFYAMEMEEKNDGLQLTLEFWNRTELAAARDDWPDQGLLLLSWPQVDEIMRAVKTKGTVQKDLRWHTEYIGERF
jgi:hypothetical protein